jgi:diguanylate cyclase (GGDEF)-like protein/PAS domain S-box-containing protein
VIILKENIVFKKVKHEQTCIDSSMLEYAEAIIQVVPTPIFIKDPDLRYLSCNSAFLNLFDLELDQVIGNRDPFLKFLSADKIYNELMNTDGSIEAEVTMTNTSGEECYYVITSSLLRDINRDSLGFIGFVRDATEEKREKKRVERLMVLKDAMIEITHVIMGNPSEQKLFDLMLQRAVEVVDKSSYGSILMRDENDIFSPVAWIGYTNDAISNFKVHLHNTFNWLATGGRVEESVMINDISSYMLPDVPDVLDTDDQGIMKATICSPIIVDGQVIGLMNMDSSMLNAFTEVDMELVDYMSEQLEIALTKHKLYDRILYLSQHDELTGILNRRQFEIHAQEKIHDAKKHNEHFCLVVFDINGLKNINDTYGHQAGDIYIQAFTSELKGLFGESDYFGRYGGDEFIGLFSSMKKEAIKDCLETALENLKYKPIDNGNHKFLISFSYGVACYPEDGISYEKLVSVADRFMYAHKDYLKQSIKEIGM